MWNLRKLMTYYGFNLLNRERAKHPELEGQIDPCEIPTEAELLKFRPYAELTRIELQYDVEGLCYADQIQDDMDGPVWCDREMIARMNRDRELLEDWEEMIFTAQYETVRHGEDFFEFLHG